MRHSDMENMMEDKMEGGSEMGEAKGHNAGRGNRAVAAHIKAMHNGAGKNGNSVSSMIGPKSVKHSPGASSSVLKTPRRSHSKSSGLMD